MILHAIVDLQLLLGPCKYNVLILFFFLAVCGKCLIHPLFVLYLFCSTPATVVHILQLTVKTSKMKKVV